MANCQEGGALLLAESAELSADGQGVCGAQGK